MRILLIDNNDSFTYNILELLRKIGFSKTDVLNSNSIQLEEISEYDKIIISPGPGLPSDFPILYKIIDKYKTEKSILGICLGHQAICSYFNADLIKMPVVCHGQAHKLSVLKNTKLYIGLPDTFNVGLYHSWAVGESGFPSNLDITGMSEMKTIMSVVHKKYDLHGIQFHPESFISEYGAEILKNFLTN